MLEYLCHCVGLLTAEDINLINIMDDITQNKNIQLDAQSHHHLPEHTLLPDTDWQILLSTQKVAQVTDTVFKPLSQLSVGLYLVALVNHSLHAPTERNL
jgi:hypothetical protein